MAAITIPGDGVASAVPWMGYIVDATDAVAELRAVIIPKQTPIATRLARASASFTIERSRVILVTAYMECGRILRT
jgi:regulator of sirC expression with transglutaminase-like and TPR domain